MAVAAISSLFLWLLPIPVWQPIGQPGIVGNVVTGEMSFQDFTIIDVEKGFKVVITQADSYSVRLTTDDMIFDDIHVSQTGVAFDSKQLEPCALQECYSLLSESL